MGSWSPWIRKGDPSFQLLLNNRSGRCFRVYFYAFDLLNRAGTTYRLEHVDRRRELRLAAAERQPRHP